jgi:hypothetical protein
MSLNAWLYVYANPISSVDPSGRCADDPNGVCGSSGSPDFYKEMFRLKYGLILDVHEFERGGETIKGQWDRDAYLLLNEAVYRIASRFYQSVDWTEVEYATSYFHKIPQNELFRIAFNGLTIKRGNKDELYVPDRGRVYGWISDENTYIAYGPKENWKPGSISGQNIIFHEFGHILDKRADYWVNGRWAANYHTQALIYAYNHCSELGGLIDYIQEREAIQGTGDNGIGKQSGLGVNLRSDYTFDEIWADLFASWVRNSFYSLPSHNEGQVFKNYIDPYMTRVVTSMAIDWVYDHGLLGY